MEHDVNNNVESENWSSDDCDHEDGYFYGCTDVSEVSVACIHMVDLRIIRYGKAV